MKKLCSGLILILMIAAPMQVNAQSFEEKRRQLIEEQAKKRAEINVLSAQIKNYESKINQTEKEYQQVFRQFENSRKLIALQDEKIKQLTLEQRQVEEEISLTRGQILVQQKNLGELIRNYKQIMLYSYKNGRSSTLELLLTSTSINEMMVRAYYLRKFEEQRIKQANQIKKVQEELTSIQNEMEDVLIKNEEVLLEIREEKGKLNEQQAQQQKNVELLQKDKKMLQGELVSTQKKIQSLEGAIADLISEEIRLQEAEAERLRKLAEAERISDAGQRATEVAKYSTSLVAESAFSEAELEAFASAFESAKGNLPWPVAGTISSRFGRKKHPVYGTVTENIGIEIVAKPSSEVRVVQDGYVFAVQPLRGYGEVVFVRHGNYYSVYGNLSDIVVPKYALLKKGDLIGFSGTQQSEMGETLFFMISKGTQNVDPELWLKRK